MLRKISLLLLLSLTIAISINMPVHPVSAAGTTSLTVTRYADDGTTILDQEVVDYEWMENNLTPCGDGVTHYYHQGPSFDGNNLWDSGIAPEPAPGETVNVESRDLGAAIGVDLRDLLALVGGAPTGSTIEVKAADNFYKRFYANEIYSLTNITPAIAYYNDTFGGYVTEGYDTGMRLIFMDSNTNSLGQHVFGNWDMHQAFADEYRHYYGGEWPSSSGLSVQNIAYINIYPPQPAGKTLTMSVSGSGTVTRNPDQSTYPPGTVVSLTATPSAGWQFVNWTGSVANPVSSTTTVTMDSDKTVTANFVRTWQLTMAVNGSGITAPAIGAHTFPQGSVVNIIATPTTGWQFVNWTGSVANPALSTTTVLMDSDKTITANFNRVYALSVSVNGTGTVVPAAGVHYYPPGTVVNISAVPAAEWSFVNWTGDVVNETSSSTSITMDTDKSIAANFGRTETTTDYDLTIVISGSGSTAPQAGVHSYTEGSVVNLRAIPASGWRFLNWTGAVADPDSPDTTALIDANKAVKANFVQDVPSTQEYRLVLKIEGEGIVNPTVGDYPFAPGQTIEITAVPAQGWQFDGWIGEVTDPVSAKTTVMMNAGKEVKARFVPVTATTTLEQVVGAIQTSAVQVNSAFNTSGTLVKTTTLPEIENTSRPVPWYIFLIIAAGGIAVALLALVIIRDMRR